MNDTSTDITLKLDYLMRKRSASERVRMVSDMFETARRLAIASFPVGLDEIELRERLCRRFYSDDIDVTAFTQAVRKQVRR
jgi:hypothetical protein